MEMLHDIKIHHGKRRGAIQRMAVLLLTIILSVSFVPYTALADEADEETEEEAEETEETEETEEPGDEPSGSGIGVKTLGNLDAPHITAEGAVLMEANNGAILYQKNMDTPYFPASITKIMTCLLAVEKSSLSETVTMSNTAVFGIDRGSSNVGLDVGQSISMEEAILCVMLASANEAASAIAEHVSGSIEEFVELMNERAKELGCTNTHFKNANGLPDEDHYISPHDMALIAKAFNDNDTCRRLGSMRTYDVAVTATQPDEIHLLNHHKMYPGLPYEYEPVVWGKTGYTIAAGATLVTVAESNGLSLICVVMKDESEKNYTDTRILFDYGFNNFTRLNISENDDSYRLNEAPFFQTGDLTFGDTKSFITLDPKSFVVVPEGIPFSRLTSEVEYEGSSEDDLGKIVYRLDGEYAGECFMTAREPGEGKPIYETMLTETEKEKGITYINVKDVLMYMGIGIGAVVVIIILIHLVKAYNFETAFSKRMSIKKRRNRYHSDFDDIDF